MITDELRKWAECGALRAGMSLQTARDQVLAIADHIDSEYQKAMDEWKAKHGQMWLKGYSECHAELLEGNETLAADLESCGWIRLPKDADGEYVHVGDVMVYADGNTCPMKVVALVPPSVFLTDDGPRYADMCRHYKPTVVDVLREFGDWYAYTKGGCDEDGIIAEYAAKLQLKEDA